MPAVYHSAYIAAVLLFACLAAGDEVACVLSVWHSSNQHWRVSSSIHKLIQHHWQWRTGRLAYFMKTHSANNLTWMAKEARGAGWGVSTRVHDKYFWFYLLAGSFNARFNAAARYEQRSWMYSPWPQSPAALHLVSRWRLICWSDLQQGPHRPARP